MMEVGSAGGGLRGGRCNAVVELLKPFPPPLSLALPLSPHVLSPCPSSLCSSLQWVTALRRFFHSAPFLLFLFLLCSAFASSPPHQPTFSSSREVEWQYGGGRGGGGGE